MKRAVKIIFMLTIILCFVACVQKGNHKTANDHAMEQTKETSRMLNKDLKQIDEAIKQYISRDKFIETADYPGIGDEELRKPLNELLNILADTFQKIAHNQPNEKQFQIAVKQLMDNMNNIYLDSEDQDQFCRSIEALMDIVGLESSDGSLNTWRYGFDPEQEN